MEADAQIIRSKISPKADRCASRAWYGWFQFFWRDWERLCANLHLFSSLHVTYRRCDVDYSWLTSSRRNLQRHRRRSRQKLGQIRIHFRVCSSTLSRGKSSIFNFFTFQTYRHMHDCVKNMFLDSIPEIGQNRWFPAPALKILGQAWLCLIKIFNFIESQTFFHIARCSSIHM